MIEETRTNASVFGERIFLRLILAMIKRIENLFTKGTKKNIGSTYRLPVLSVYYKPNTDLALISMVSGSKGFVI
jgi:hypothetical protein